MAQTMFQGYEARLHRHLESGKACGEMASELDSKAAATLFIGAIQGPVIATGPFHFDHSGISPQWR